MSVEKHRNENCEQARHHSIIHKLHVLTRLNATSMHAQRHICRAALYQSQTLRHRNSSKPTIIIIPRLEKRITQRQLHNPLHVRIIHKFRINVEEHRHIDRLPSIQPLLLKAKALDLAEIRRYLARCYAVRRHSYYVFAAVIRGCIECQCRLAW